MSEWRSATVSELEAERVLLVQDGNHGNDRPLAHEFVKVGTPFIRAADMADGRVLFDQASRIDDSALARIRKGHGRAGDSLLSHKGTVGKVAYVPLGAAPFVCSPQTTFWRSLDVDAIDPRFLNYVLRSPSFVAQLDSQKGETDMAPYVSLTQQRQLRLTIPPLAEQQAIAEVLGALDDKIAANTALAATAREFALSMLRIDSVTTSLGNVVIHHKQQVHPASLDEPLVEHYSLPAFDGGAGPEVTAPRNIQSSKFRVDTPALLVSKLNPRTPRNWPVSGVGTRPRLASTEFLVLEPLVCDPWVMWALVSQPNFTRELEGKVAGTSGSHQRVRPEEVLATPILDPRAIQPQLLADIREVLMPIDALDAENRTLAATRDALLPQLMAGKLRVRDAEAAASEAGA